MQANVSTLQTIMKYPRTVSVALGLAVGDSLGATSEFQIPWYIKTCTFFKKYMKGSRKNCIEKYPGWPAKLVGGGKAHWL